MENIADALKIAGSVLLFVLALSVTMTSFGQARETADTILHNSDRITEYIDVSDTEVYNQFFYVRDSRNETREVGLETIIPTIYRAFLENYKIVFDFSSGPNYLYKHSDGVEEHSIDLAKLNIPSDTPGDSEMLKFIEGIIYGTGNSTVLKSFKDIQPIYPRINRSGVVVKEKMGLYYQEDIGNPNEKTGIEDANKNEKRVITYVVE